MLEHDVRLRVLTAAVKSDADISATLLAHCVWSRIAHEPDDLAAILTNDITPATIFAGGPVTALFENSRLWTIVRTALIKLRQLPDDIVTQIFALNTRLADAVIAHQNAAPADKLPRFVISRTSAPIVRKMPAVPPVQPAQTVSIGPAQFTIPITAPPVWPAARPAKPRAADDDETDSSSSSDTEAAVKTISTDRSRMQGTNPRCVAHLIVRESNRYHAYSPDKLVPCNYRGCDQGIHKKCLRESVSMRIFDQTCWQSFFCTMHVEVADSMATALPPILFCVVCASMEFKLTTIHIRKYQNTARRLQICTDCLPKPHVCQQLRLMRRRRIGRRTKSAPVPAPEDAVV